MTSLKFTVVPHPPYSRCPEGSISLTFSKAYQYLSYKHSQLPKDTTARCREDCPYFNHERHFRARRAKKATWERSGHLNAEHTRLGVDNTLSSQAEYQHGYPEKHYLRRSIGGSCRRAYEQLSTEHSEFGRVMTMQFDKECQHQNSEHVELGTGVAQASEEGHKIFNPGHIGIIFIVPSYEGNKHLISEHTRPWMSATLQSQKKNQHLT